MTWVADYSFARPDLAALKAAGCAGIVRYAQGGPLVPGGHPKGVEKAEVDTALALGLTVLIVQESGRQPALAGFSGGEAEARSANVAADQVGYPRDCWIIYVAEDPNKVDVAAWPVVEAYFRGVQSVRGRPQGGYGSLPLLNHLASLGLITRKWAVEFWGGHAGADLAQYAAPVPAAFANDIDADLVLSFDYGQYPRPTPTPPPASVPPTPQETDMPTFHSGYIPTGFAFSETGTLLDITKTAVVVVPPAGGGALGWGNMWFSLGCDFGDVAVRVAIHNGTAGWRHIEVVPVTAAGVRWVTQLHQGDDKICLARCRQTAADTADSPPVGWLLEAGSASGAGGSPVPAP